MIDPPRKRKKSALDKAMDFLAIRDHSEKELKEKLAQRDYRESEILSTTQKLKEQRHILPPEELAEKISLRLIETGKGVQYIQNYLKKKGLPPACIDQDLEIDRGLILIEKKLGLNTPYPTDVLAKLRSFLQNRGYTFESIQRIIKHE